MNAQHEKWFLGMRAGLNANLIYARDGEDQHSDSAIAQVYGIPQHTSLEEVSEMTRPDVVRGLARGRLLAAAPEMLAALKRFVDFHESGMPLAGCADFARAAIAKAESAR